MRPLKVIVIRGFAVAMTAPHEVMHLMLEHHLMRVKADMVYRGVSAGDLLGFGPAGPDTARMRDGKTADSGAADSDQGADGKTVES